MLLKVNSYCQAEDFDRPEAIEYFLNKALQSGDPSHIAAALGVVARARGMTSVADDSGLCREQLYRSLSESGNPTLKTLVKILTSLGYGLQIRKAP